VPDDTIDGDAPAGHAPELPSEDLTDVSSAALVELEATLAAVSGAEDAATRALRRQADAAVVERLRADGFTGPRYDRVIGRLMEYSLAVLMKWNANGTIFRKSRQAGRPVPPEKITLEWDFEERRDVAVDTILEGEALFRKHGLIRGRWHPGGGAGLSTYFVGATVLAFRPVYLRWYNARESMRAALEEAARGGSPGSALAGIPDQRATDPQDAAEFWDQVTQLAIADEQTRGGLYWYAQGFTQREAALKVGLSPRALEGRIRRLRRQIDIGPGEEGTR
jgi:hypothetical protein